ncbi:CDP-alcohol phosphatidyltransferase family protein [Ascidiimonas aurantiaca]|uniref:CDP-alcohol phosphatidyltransferase family protein n=1 Tax=Ascidiimonas aurantiaca TaxID=1685432 RepID=UPI0030EBB439
MKKHIPNILTLMNLFCGCIAIVFAMENQLEMAALFVFLGIVFDFFDGLAARLLKVQSALGLQLDSLADVVTSGVVPGIVMFKLFHLASPNWYTWDSVTTNESLIVWKDIFASGLPLAGFLITLAAAYRLAKFNIDEEQATSFIGLPTPANALFVMSLPLILAYQENDAINQIIVNQWFLLIITILSAIIMNARLPLFALKFKSFSFKDNAVRYTFLLFSLVLLIVLKFAALPLIILLYIALSFIAGTFFKKAI